MSVTAPVMPGPPGGERFVYADNAAINPLPVLSQPVPFTLKLGRFHPGDILIISGRVQPSGRSVSVSLLDTEPGRAAATVPLRVTVDVAYGAVTCNNKQAASGWQAEERMLGYPYGLYAGTPLEAMVLLHRDAFKMAFNGGHLCSFEHRGPYDEIAFVSVDGDVDLYSVMVQRGPGGPGGRRLGMPRVPHSQSQVEVPSDPDDEADSSKRTFLEAYGVTLPYTEMIPGGMRSGRVLYVSLIPAEVGDQFAINLKTVPGLRKSRFEFALHLKVMLRDRMIVLNSKEAKWGREEQIRDRFCFSRGVHHDVVIVCEADVYKVSVNGQHLTTYSHRLNILDAIGVLEITGAAKVVHLRLV